MGYHARTTTDTWAPMNRLWATLEPPTVTLPELYRSRQDVFWNQVRAVEAQGDRLFGDLLQLGPFSRIADCCPQQKFGASELPALATGLKYFNM